MLDLLSSTGRGEWEGRGRTRPVHLDVESQSRNGNPRSRNPERMSRVTPVAPPLESFLPDAPGSSPFYDNVGYKLGKNGGDSAVASLSPSMLMKVEKLRLIRTTGYYTIAPIGINKTMAQLDYEAQEMEDEECNVGQAENLNANVSTSVYQDASPRLPETGTEHDLDAEVEDADASANLLTSSDLSDRDSDQQNDLEAGDIAIRSHDSMSDSHPVTMSLGAVTAGLSTAATSEGSGYLLNCDVSDVEMAIEEN